MQEIAIIAGCAVYFLTSLTVGGRLTALALRSGGTSELGLGLFLVVGGAFGYSVGVLAHFSRLMSDATVAWVQPVTLIFSFCGSAALLWFTWRVFRAASTWAAALFYALCALMLVSLVGQWMTIGFGRTQMVGWAFNLGHVVRCVSFGWAAVESLVYHRRARARLALGLTDPLTANRFLFWGIACGMPVLTFISSGVVQIAAPEHLFSPAGTLWISFVGTASALLIWVAFFPPAAYRRRLTARAGAAAP